MGDVNASLLKHYSQSVHPAEAGQAAPLQEVERQTHDTKDGHKKMPSESISTITKDGMDSSNIKVCPHHDSNFALSRSNRLQCTFCVHILFAFPLHQFVRVPQSPTGEAADEPSRGSACVSVEGVILHMFRKVCILPLTYTTVLQIASEKAPVNIRAHTDMMSKVDHLAIDIDQPRSSGMSASNFSPRNPSFGFEAITSGGLDVPTDAQV